VATSTEDILQDEIERTNLLKAISDVETVHAVSTPGTRSVFDNFLQNAKARLGVLEKKIHEAQREKEKEISNQVAMASLAQGEAGLNADEKETYSGFLKEDFFTKKDFHRLDDFYAHTWDRLSEHGKDEMSRRVWEGVRRDEYKFVDLPKDVQDKEADRAYAVLKKRQIGAGVVAAIPEKDRQDFVTAYESGNKKQAEQILDRKSFGENMFVASPSAARQSIAADKGQDAKSQQLAGDVKSGAAASTSTPSNATQNPLGNKDFSSLNLAGTKSPDGKAPLSPTQLPVPLVVNVAQR
jgi:hypothetical protein